jgi:enoyl-CoA hydratase/carnithine racemase
LKLDERENHVTDWTSAPAYGEFETLDVRLLLDGRVLGVTLNRPDRRNAFDTVMMTELRRLWTQAGSLSQIRCIVITGAGPGFCTGADVELLKSDRTEVGRDAREELSFLPRHLVEVPVIVAVNGVCAGGGLHFVGDADIVIASEAATFMDPHVSVGQVTALEPVMLLARARFDAVVRMALLGRSERLGAEAALHAGLVSEVVAADQLLDRALELAGGIAANSPAAVRRSRAVIIDWEDSASSEILDRGWDSVREHWSHPDAKEGPTAFLERRQPEWVD